jgi:hypothetical protein
MAKEKAQKERSLVSMTGEEREETWDEVFVKEEGIIIDFDGDLNIGKIKSVTDGQVYDIDGRECARTVLYLLKFLTRPRSFQADCRRKHNASE